MKSETNGVNGAARSITIPLTEAAYGLLAAMAMHDGHESVDVAVRVAISRDVFAFMNGAQEEHIEEMFGCKPRAKSAQEDEQ